VKVCRLEGLGRIRISLQQGEREKADLQKQTDRERSWKKIKKLTIKRTGRGSLIGEPEGGTVMRDWPYYPMIQEKGLGGAQEG